jgi:hypothetical protein
LLSPIMLKDNLKKKQIMQNLLATTKQRLGNRYKKKNKEQERKNIKRGYGIFVREKWNPPNPYINLM